MGRIRNWMDRISGRRRDASHREVPRARRRLAFERCEPRLTLSAAAPTAIDESPTDATILFDVVGLQTFDSISWEQTQPQGQPATSVFRDGLRAILSAQGGGVVDLKALPLSGIAIDGTATFSFFETTQSIVRAAFDGDSIRLQAGTATPSLNSQLATLETAFGDSSYQPDLLPDWNTFVPSTPDDGLSAQGPTNLYGAGGDLESELIRIDAPQQKQSEGGTIELTAMLGPQSTLSATAPLRLAASSGLEGEVTAMTTSAPGPQRQAPPTEGLRARAVVVNVALVRESAEVDDSASLSPRLANPSRGEQSAAAEGPDAAPQSTRDANGRFARDRDVEPPGVPQQAADAAAGDVVPAAAAQADQTEAGETAAVERRAAYDAALGDWAPIPTERDAEADVSVAGSHDRRFIGAAVALVVGAGPVVRRARRARGAMPVEVAAGQY